MGDASESIMKGKNYRRQLIPPPKEKVTTLMGDGGARGPPSIFLKEWGQIILIFQNASKKERKGPRGDDKKLLQKGVAGVARCLPKGESLGEH